MAPRAMYWLFDSRDKQDRYTLVTISGDIYDTNLALVDTVRDPYNYVHIAREDKSFIGEEIMLSDLPKAYGNAVKKFLNI